MDMIVDGVSFIGRRKKLIVDNINFEVKDGTMCGIIGDKYVNLIKIFELMSGKTFPTSGCIYLISRDGSEKKDKLSKAIALCNVNFGIRCLQSPYNYLISKGREFTNNSEELAMRVQELLTFVKLKKESTNIYYLSMVEKYKLALAKALIQKPNVLLIDIHSNCFDPREKDELLNIIEMLKGTITIILLSNNIYDIDNICDSIVIVKNNGVLVSEYISELKAIYSHKGLIVKVGGNTSLAHFIKELEKQQWVKRVVGTTNGRIKIFINNVEKANLNLPVLITDQKIELLEYLHIGTSLESIYIDLQTKDYT